MIGRNKYENIFKKEKAKHSLRGEIKHMKKFISKEIKGEIYTLVDEFDDIFEKRKVYYFYSALNNQNIYFYKEREEYIQIASKEEIDIIENQKNLGIDEFLFSYYTIESVLKGMRNLRKMSTEERQDFLQKQYEKLKALDIKDVDYEKIRKGIFGRGDIYVADKIPRADGMYHAVSQNIYLLKESSEIVDLHETIHKITGATLKGKILCTLSKRIC